MDIDKGYQQFTAHDTISVFVLIFLILGIFAYVGSGNLADSKSQVAHFEAIKLVQQLSSNNIVYQSEVSGETDRWPATEALKLADYGSIGLDPWGRPYAYKVITDGSAGRTIVILSYGPNQKRETSDESIERATPKSIGRNLGPQPMMADGDDILFAFSSSRDK